MSALLVAVLVVAIVGHLVLVRTSMDRAYALGLPQRLWHGLFALHVVAAVAVPVLLVREADDRSPLWIGYVVASTAVIPIGLIVSILNRRRAVPPCQLSNHTTRHDAVIALGRTPAAANLLGRIARLPGNEVFRVDVVERQIRLPRLPTALDGLSILHLTDLHMNGTPDRSFFEWAVNRCRELKPDLIALTGDVVDRRDLLDWLPTTVGRLTAPLGCYFVLGNHDVPHADALRSALERLGWVSLAGQWRAIAHGGQRILVTGTERPWIGEHPTLDGSADPALRILLAHPPYEIRWARRQGFDLMLAGHLHGGQIRWPLVGPMTGGRFAAGLFDLPPTVMHVSRGLGQMAPLRWGCPPEIAKLVLRAEGRVVEEPAERDVV